MDYSSIQNDYIARRQNGIEALKIVSIDADKGLCLSAVGFDTVFLTPSNFEDGNYRIGQWVDCMIFLSNGIIGSCQYIGMTPPDFIPAD